MYPTEIQTPFRSCGPCAEGILTLEKKRWFEPATAYTRSKIYDENKIPA